MEVDMEDDEDSSIEVLVLLGIRRWSREISDVCQNIVRNVLQHDEEIDERQSCQDDVGRRVHVLPVMAGRTERIHG